MITEYIHKNKLLFNLLFGLMVILQLTIPAYMIWHSKQIGANGSVYKFEMVPRSPNGIFRGNHVHLTPRSNSINTTEDIDHRNVYATFFVDSLGYAQVASLTALPPDTDNYLKVKRSKRVLHGEEFGHLIIYPFEKYFINPEKSRRVEQLLAESDSGSIINYSAEVSILNGEAKVLNVTIKDKSLEELIEKSKQ